LEPTRPAGEALVSVRKTGLCKNGERTLKAGSKYLQNHPFDWNGNGFTSMSLKNEALKCSRSKAANWWGYRVEKMLREKWAKYLQSDGFKKLNILVWSSQRSRSQGRESVRSHGNQSDWSRFLRSG